MKAMCVNFKSLIIKSLVFIAIGIAACERSEFNNPNEDDVISVEMEDGTSLLEDEKKDTENGYLDVILDINENSFYYRGRVLSPSIGKIEGNEISWMKKEVTNAYLAIKSENEKLNNSFLIANINSAYGKVEWLVRIYKNSASHVTERRFTPPFENAEIKALYQLKNTPKEILNQYKNAGIDINKINADYEIFCILGAVNRSAFLYFIAVSYNQYSNEIIPLPSLIQAETKKISSTNQKYLVFENIAQNSIQKKKI